MTSTITRLRELQKQSPNRHLSLRNREVYPTGEYVTEICMSGPHPSEDNSCSSTGEHKDVPIAITLDVQVGDLFELLCELYNNANPILHALASATAERDRLQERLDKAVDALNEIAEGRGRFSLDQLTHASNTIEDMKAIATGTLASLTAAQEGKEQKHG